MANPVTAIRGPNIAHPRTFVFYINPSKRLALDQFIDDEGKDSYTFVKWSAYGSKVFAPMLTPSNIQAIYQYGVIKVFGFVQPNTDKNSYIISELTPTTRYLANDDDNELTALTTPFTKLAVVGDGGNTTWFYYFTQESDAKPLKIRVARKEDKGQFNFQTVKDADPGSKSSIAAAYLPETKTRLVFWQKADNRIFVATITDQTIAISNVDNTSLALPGTALAVTYAGDDKNRVLYLYYINQSQQLSRTVGRWSGTSWVWTTTPAVLATTVTVSSDGQLSVVQSGDKNQIFYVQEESEVYTSLVDNVKEFNKPAA